jgi:hypothetical protein
MEAEMIEWDVAWNFRMIPDNINRAHTAITKYFLAKKAAAKC